MYSSEGTISQAEQELLKKKVSKPRLMQEDESLKFTNLQDGQISVEQCLDNLERTSGHQYSSNKAIETEIAAVPFIANEIPKEAVDAEGNVAAASGEVKTVVGGLSLLPKTGVGLLTISEKVCRYSTIFLLKIGP